MLTMVKERFSARKIQEQRVKPVMTKTKVKLPSNDFATELTFDDKRKIQRNWDIVVGVLPHEGPVIDFSVDGFKQTPVLTKHSIRICERCGMLQPMEVIGCKVCGEL